MQNSKPPYRNRLQNKNRLMPTINCYTNKTSAIGADALASEYFDAWKSGEAEINSMQSSIGISG